MIVRGSIPADHVSEEFYFDEATGLLVRVTTFTQTAVGVIPSMMSFSEYRTVKGIKVPFKLVSVSGRGTVTEVRFKSAKANVALDDKIFTMPQR